MFLWCDKLITQIYFCFTWTFSNTVIPALYEEADEELLELSDIAFVALTSERWTSRATERFLTVTAHYITLK